MSIVSTESYVHTILLRPLPRFKMGWPDAYAGAYSRRINIQDRIVYEVFLEEKTVRVLRMWTHYE